MSTANDEIRNSVNTKNGFPLEESAMQPEAESNNKDKDTSASKDQDSRHEYGVEPSKSSTKEHESAEEPFDILKEESKLVAESGEEPLSADEISNLASFSTTSKILEIYMERLRLNESKGLKKSDTTSQLLYGIADYLRDIEDRMRKLESGVKVDADKGNTAPGKNQASDASNEASNGRDTAPEENQASDPATNSSSGDTASDESSVSDSANIKTVFCTSDEEQAADFFDVTGDKRWEDRKKSDLTAKPKHFLTVLCETQTEHTTKTSSKWTLEPGTDILALRLYSKPLALFFEKLADYSVHTDHLVRMTKAFAFLIRNTSAIKDRLSHLEQTHTSQILNSSSDTSPTDGGHSVQPSLTGSNPSMTSPVSAQDPWETVEALHHFRELVTFLDQYLLEKMRLYTELRAGSLTHVAFEDLWMLFERNDTIVCPKRKRSEFLYTYGSRDDSTDIFSGDIFVPQAIRVLTCHGGIPLVGKLVRSNSHKFSVEKKKTEKLPVRMTRKTAEPEDQMEIRLQKHTYGPLYLYCFILVYRGLRWTPSHEVFVIKPYERPMEITSLQVYPIRYSAQGDSGVDFVSRGKKYIEYTTISHLQYKGLTLGDDCEEIDGPIIVDFEQAQREREDMTYNPRHEFFSKYMPIYVGEMPVVKSLNGEPDYLFEEKSLHDRDESYDILKKVQEQLDEYSTTKTKSRLSEFIEAMEKSDLLELIIGNIRGFALRDRKWKNFDVSLLQEMTYNDASSGWNDLILPKSHRTMVQSMVQTHTANFRRSDLRNDIGIVQGKGKGCIILLHGVPGVGKTSTAECVAAYTGRPLFPITGGDIGYEPIDVETKLQLIFTRAHRWGCVLLIDEADVFLAERDRDKSDVKRNGLVSVFLRVLEYYSGILFLTTNRVGAFDDAFRSRIHLTLYYPKLDKKDSKKIWAMNIRRIKRMNETLEAGQPPIKYDRRRILEFAKDNYDTLRWNGRQIQNAFQTALALARFDVGDALDKSPRIKVRHFEIIGQASIQFDEYLYDVHVGDETKKAKNQKLRADEWKLASSHSGSRSKGLVRGDWADEMSSSSGSETTDTDSDEDRPQKQRRKSTRKAYQRRTEKVKRTSDDEQQQRHREKGEKSRSKKNSDQKKDENGSKKPVTNKMEVSTDSSESDDTDE